MIRIISIITISLAYTSITYPTQTNIQRLIRNTSPDNIVFCWDIHNTLVNAKTWKRTKMGLKCARLFTWGESWLPDFKPYKIYKTALKETGDASGEYLADLFTKKAKELRTIAQNSGQKLGTHRTMQQSRRYEKLAKLFGSFELQYTHMDGIIPLLQELKRNGYPNHYVASNIGSGVYPKMKSKFPEIFNANMVKDGLVADTWEQPITKKPHSEFFNRLKKTVNQDENKIIIFIDDNSKNIKAAQNAGIIGIQFTNTKKLINDLRILGILI